MSEATVKALTDAVYDALAGSDPVRELDNEQVYEVARLAAAQTIESANTTKAIVRAWLAEADFSYDRMMHARRLLAALEGRTGTTVQDWLIDMAEAIREVSS